MGRAPDAATLFAVVVFITQLWLFGGCNGKVDDTNTPITPYSRNVSWSDDAPGTAFGSALAADSSGVWVGVPEDAQGWIQRIESGALSTHLDSGSPWGLGHVLAWDSTLGLAAGAPLAGDREGRLVSADGSTILAGEPGQRLGSAMAATPDGWIVGGNQVIIGPNTHLSPPGRPRSLVLFEDRIVAGIAGLQNGIWLEDGVLETESPNSLAGMALCVADVDDDHQEELLIGAPGVDRVYVLDTLPETGPLEDHAQVFEGEGHFGWSIACGSGEFWVGAPLYGDEQQGGAYRVGSGDPSGEQSEPWFSGEGSGSQLGYALALGPDEIWIGSPGNAQEAGRVDCNY